MVAKPLCHLRLRILLYFVILQNEVLDVAARAAVLLRYVCE